MVRRRQSWQHWNRTSSLTDFSLKGETYKADPVPFFKNEQI